MTIERHNVFKVDLIGGSLSIGELHLLAKRISPSDALNLAAWLYIMSGKPREELDQLINKIEES